MRYQRTQIYLDPEEHKRLTREAAERGLSLAEYLRRVIGARVGESAPAYAPESFDAIFDLATGEEQIDTVTTMDDEAARAFAEEHARSVARRKPAAKPAPKRRAR